MPFQVFLQQIFHPFQVNHHEQSLKKLNELGGYQVFLNELIIQSDSSNFEGSNDKKQHFLEYILLYLVSLSLFSKILLYYHNAIDSLKILSESIGIIFLGVLIVWKKKRDQIHINQNKQSSHRTSKNKYNVHRNGQDLQIQENQLKQGDYVYITAPQVLQFDAILFQVEKNSSMDQSSYKYVLVNEKAVDPSRSETPKYSIKEACDNHELDPFLFRNSTLQEGSCWAIVCAVGGRKPSEIFSESVEHRLLGLSKANNFVRVVKAWIVLPILLLGVQWMSLKEGNRYEVFLKFLSLVASLLLYLQYANQNEMLWLIIGYFSESQQGENYKIKDDKIMYKLQTIDVIAIQQDNFSQNINELSELACSYDIKIITTKSQKRIENEFAFLAENIVFKDDLSLSIKKRLQMLNKSKFISCSVSFFVQYYLPLLQSMKFSVLFIPNQEQMKLVCSNLPKNSVNYRQLDDYIKIKNRNILLQSFLQLEERSRKMIRLRNCYIGILFNSCIELIIMILWACKGCIIELNLNLFILYTTRNKSLQLFQDYKSETYVNVTEQKHRWWALNLALIFYYIFMMQEINCSQDRQYLLFLFLMTNRLFRLQPLHLHSDRRKIKYIKRVGGIIFLMIINACLGYYQMRKWQIKTEWEAILLFPLIIWLYSTFL